MKLEFGVLPSLNSFPFGYWEKAGKIEEREIPGFYFYFLFLNFLWFGT